MFIWPLVGALGLAWLARLAPPLMPAGAMIVAEVACRQLEAADPMNVAAVLHAIC